ncbi:MAG: TetR/AcrR family transcriptional regulator [Spirochaetaceae bacterium]|nr:MAG: TetR/AcrR family transcriptional regulator [Spirochaetaceae bacterium]
MTRLANPELPGKLLSVAEQIVVKSGHQALNMRDLARRVGVTATAIYHYFESKEVLLLKIKLRAAEKLNSRIRAIDPKLGPVQTIRELGMRYIEFAEEHPNLYRLLFDTPIGTTPLGQTDQPVLYYTYYVARNALERMAAAEMYPHDPRYGAMMGWTMLHGFCSLLMSGSLELAEGMDREQLKELFLRFYSGGGEPDRHARNS